VDKVVVGADRILKGAVVNKIGTYMIAILAHAHNIPFYVAAPKSTFDINRSPEDVIVEERKRSEVVCFAGKQVAPRDVSVLNPAFDVTPSKYITAIISDKGVFFSEDYPKLWSN
jgi:methylthioribose-1-phosphate isomerase